MKNKKTNKIIIFVTIGIILLVCLLIFILNYSKDDASFSILEKKWINDNKEKVLDVSVYNDVPIYGKNGDGIIFDFLTNFTKDYDMKFNKVPYFVNSTTTYNDISFKVLGYNTELSNNDILMYEDNYVLIGRDSKKIDKISDMENFLVGVLQNDLNDVTYYLEGANDISYLPYDSVDKLFNAWSLKNIDYIIIPNTLYMDKILSNEQMNIIFHINDMSKKYVLTINGNNTLYNIMKKYYNKFNKEYFSSSYNKNFINLFWVNKKLSDQEKASYNSNSYSYGFIENMPFESVINNQYVGVLSNYLKEFSLLADVDFRFVEYKSIEALKKDLSAGELDVVFANFTLDNLNIDTITTISPFEETYVVVSKKDLLLSSIKSLKGEEVMVVKNSKLDSLLIDNYIGLKRYNNLEELFSHIDNNSIVGLDYQTYMYYQNQKLNGYNILYMNSLKSDYNFVIRDVKQNQTFAKLFDYYISSINYNAIKYKYNTNFDISNPNYLNRILKYIFISLVGVLALIIVVIIFAKKNKQDTILKKEEKLKFIDAMTSLKNRNYLNYNISKWDENIIYPQSIIIVDLNNIKYINDSYGHNAGDEVIKKAASILIANQLENSDIIRTDGNEFLIYTVGYDEKQIVSYTRKIYKELKELPYEYGAAVGYSMILDKITTIDDAINEATLDMRTSKENN